MMKINNTFNQDKAKGKRGESAVINYYINKGYEVIDVSENKQFQKKDIDCLINGITTEIKTQKALEERKICLEIISNINKGNNNGWLNTTQAKQLIFVDLKNNLLYNINTVQLRNYYYKNKEKYRLLNKDSSVICFIPLDDIRNITEVTNIEL